MRALPKSICLLAIVLASGCASSGGSASSAQRGLTREAMLETGQMSVLDAIQQLRPQWLTVRGPGRTGRPPEILIFVDGALFGPVSSLSSLTVTSIRDAEFLSATEAAMRWGTVGGDGGVIAIRTR